MIDPKIQKLINDQILQLPKISQEVLKSWGWEQKLRSIGTQQGLLLDEVEKLYAETVLMLVGLEDPDLYISNLVHHVELSEELSKKVTEQVRTEILEPMAQEIIKRSENLNDTSPVSSQEAVSRTTPKRDDILQSLENPPKSTPSLAQIKLKDIFASVQTSTSMKDTPVITSQGLRASFAMQEKTNESSPSNPPKKYTSPDEDPYLEPLS